MSSPADDPEARMPSLTPPMSVASSRGGTPPLSVPGSIVGNPGLSMMRAPRPQGPFDPYATQPGTPHPASQIGMRPPSGPGTFSGPRGPHMGGDRFVKPPPPPPRTRAQGPVCSGSESPLHIQSTGADPFIKPAPPIMSRPGVMGPPQRFMGPPMRGPVPPNSSNMQRLPMPMSTPTSSSPSSAPPPDPYATPPGTPRPGPISRAGSMPSPSDPYAMQPATPRCDDCSKHFYKS
jgi:hypothetical protein